MKGSWNGEPIGLGQEGVFRLVKRGEKLEDKKGVSRERTSGLGKRETIKCG